MTRRHLALGMRQQRLLVLFGFYRLLPQLCYAELIDVFETSPQRNGSSWAVHIQGNGNAVHECAVSPRRTVTAETSRW